MANQANNQSSKHAPVVPHLQVGGPKYQQKIDEINQRLGKNPPDNQAIFDLLTHMAKDLHEIKLMLKK